MTKDSYRILATIFQLVGEYDPDAFLKAARSARVSRNLEKALLALHDESKIIGGGRHSFADQVSITALDRSKKPSSRKLASKRSSSLPVPVSDGSLRANLSSEIFEENFHRFLSDKKIFPTKRDVIKFIEPLKIGSGVSSKDSLDRFVRKIVLSVSSNSQLRKQLERSLLSDQSLQTRGWFDLISGKKDE